MLQHFPVSLAPDDYHRCPQHRLRLFAVCKREPETTIALSHEGVRIKAKHMLILQLQGGGPDDTHIGRKVALDAFMSKGQAGASAKKNRVFGVGLAESLHIPVTRGGIPAFQHSLKSLDNFFAVRGGRACSCLLYTSDAADE